MSDENPALPETPQPPAAPEPAIVDTDDEEVGPTRVQARGPEPVEERAPARVGPDKVKTTVVRADPEA